MINQMTGNWGINNPVLGQLNRQVTATFQTRFGWRVQSLDPREETQVADTLAGGQLPLAATPLVSARATGQHRGSSGTGRADCTS